MIMNLVISRLQLFFCC